MNKQKSYTAHQYGTLYLVPTPIGNLQDMTYRSIETLKQVKLIASEDTRNTQKLLNFFDIETKQTSFHDHNFQEKIPFLIDILRKGESIAQVSDAGMPSISDPGHDLVKAAIAQEIPVVSLPGATAGVTALISSGLTPQPFYFYGFLPRKSTEQKNTLEILSSIDGTLIFYESPHRVKKTLESIVDSYSADIPVVLCRELTKIHEEYLRGSAKELVDYLEENTIKGECCLLVESPNRLKQSEHYNSTLTVNEHVNLLINEQELTSKEAIKQVAKLRNLKKQDVYKAYHIHE